MDMLSTTSIYIAIPIVLYLFFLFWYGGRGKPLTQAEVESLLTEMKQRSGKESRAEESSLLNQFRELTRNDDGREFYMVNLLKFRQKALYPAGSPFDDDPLAANARYSQAILPLLLKHGGHPVFLGPVQGRFLHPGGADDWDQVGIVRYRSRRDMLKMAIEVAGLGVDIHKWAALEKTQVFPARPIFSLTLLRGILFLLLAVLTIVISV